MSAISLRQFLRNNHFSGVGGIRRLMPAAAHGSMRALLGMDADSADDERSRRRIVNGAAAVDAGVLVFTSGVHDASSHQAISP
jgi:hypothetical protein